MGPLEVQVEIGLPGEADPAQELEALLRRAGVAVDGERRGRGRGQLHAVVVGVDRDGHRGVPRHRGHLLHPYRHVGQPVLDRLELPDGPAELHPHLGVLGGRLEAPPGPAHLLGRHQGRGHLAEAPGGEGRELVAGRDHVGIRLHHAHPSGLVQTAQGGNVHTTLGPGAGSVDLEEAPRLLPVVTPGRRQHQ